MSLIKNHIDQLKQRTSLCDWCVRQLDDEHYVETMTGRYCCEGCSDAGQQEYMDDEYDSYVKSQQP